MLAGVTGERASVRLAIAALFATATTASCGDEAPAGPAPALRLWVTPAAAAPIRAFAALLPTSPVEVIEASDPVAAAAALPAPAPDVPDAPRIALVDDRSCRECFQLEHRGSFAIVHGDAPLGVQYGLAELLEAMGARFHHPERTHAPSTLALPGATSPVFAGATREPEQSLRGIQLHTLHPIEGYYALWEPSAASLAAAERQIDWLVKNRGNFLQWVALDDIQRGGSTLDAWRAHTRTIIDYAHVRGVRCGIGIQLYGTGNLQHAFDLVEDPARVTDTRSVVASRLQMLAGLGFDHVTLSFGEFSSEDPARFVADVDIVRAALDDALPGVTMSTAVHVGNYPSLRVTYMGETLLYYFLVKFADARIEPWVHTVMYYNLFDDAGGAYRHDMFDEHRAFLLDRLARGLPVAYFPESAYWVAFDDSVPTYLPVYVRSRHRDLEQIRAAGVGELRQHVLFSSGWEWGYWLNDVSTLRMGYALPSTWDELVRWALEPWAADGERVAAAIVAVGNAQYDGLIGQRLAAYLAARDAIIDIGETIGDGIVSQPDRPSFDEIGAMTAAERATFRTSVLEPLRALAGTHEAALATVADVPREDPFVAEALDGMELTGLRARFAADVFDAATTAADGGDASALRAAATDELARALTVVERRNAAFHDPSPARLLGAARNATLYPHGYLFFTADLCFWRRELALLARTLDHSPDPIPSCSP